MAKTPAIIEHKIKDKIHTIRGFQVMLDRDLADLYNIETRVLKQAVKRNHKRFPPDFMFVLTENEINYMVSQNVIPSKKHLVAPPPLDVPPLLHTFTNKDYWLLQLNFMTMSYVMNSCLDGRTCGQSLCLSAGFALFS